MDILYLLRHGPAVESGTPGIADDDRPLTPKGRRRARRVAYGLDRLKLRLDAILTSPLPRARETAEITAEVLGLSGVLESSDRLRAGVSSESVRDWLGTRGESRLMLVGHDPWISDLVALLTVGRADAGVCALAKGGIAALTGRGDGSYQLDWLARPRLLRKIGE
jgi:phosphohistidine phosphatase